MATLWEGKSWDVRLVQAMYEIQARKRYIESLLRRRKVCVCHPEVGYLTI